MAGSRGRTQGQGQKGPGQPSQPSQNISPNHSDKGTCTHSGGEEAAVFFFQRSNVPVDQWKRVLLFQALNCLLPQGG